MDKREQIARMAQTKEDEILLARVYERITSAAARNIPAATAFLSKREQMLAAELLRGQDFVFFGGPAMAEREVCCYVPEYLDESWLTGDEGPIAAVRAVYFAGDTLTHRDFLGALMGCGIKRETVGDIYVSEGSCDFLVTREILPYLLQNFLSAGRTKLHVEQLPIDQIRVPEQKVKAVRDTVSSLRLDGVVSSGFSISRGKDEPYLLGRRLSANVVYRSLAILFLGIVVSGITAIILILTCPLEQNGLTGVDAAFEAVSAFATVGVSSGVTAVTNWVGKIALTLTMFIGRVGPVSFGLTLAAQQKVNRKLIVPEGKIVVG